MNPIRKITIWIAILIGAISIKVLDSGYELLLVGDHLGGWVRIIATALLIMWYTREAPKVE